MIRFSTIEDARETFSYADEDIQEASAFIDKGDNLTAYHMLDRMVKDMDVAAKLFPEMSTELEAIADKVKPVLMRIVYVK